MTESTTLINKIMKTKDNLLSVLNVKTFLVLAAIPLILIAFSSCAAKKAISKTKTEIPPPPPPPPPQQNPALKDNAKVIKETATDESEQEPFVVVEEMPMFPGGDVALLKYVAENTQYPENARKNNIQGRVITRFCVTAKGNVSLVTVLRGVDPEIDAEAVRVVSSLPAFKPGRQGGKDVPVWYMVPITFELSKSEEALPLPPSPPPFPTSSVKESDSGMTDGAYQKVDEMPVYPGGDSELLNFIGMNTTYPKEAKEKGIQGKVITRFKVKEDGSVADVSVLQGVNTAIDNEAVRVIHMLPNFTPGKLNGKTVAVWYMVPITFTLK
jgi:TonB family protein